MQFSWQRILRDVLMLVGFCGAFMVFLTLFGGLESGDRDDEIHFSLDRVKANRSQNRKDWETARLNLTRILDRDPHDGRAQFELASTFYRQRNNLISDMNELIDLGKQESEEGLRMQANIQELSQQTVEELTKAKRFARYRGRALLILAVISAEGQNWDATLAHLEEFVDTGNYTFDGLKDARIFGYGGESMAGLGAKTTPFTRLHAEPRFWDICRRELANRAQ